MTYETVSVESISALAMMVGVGVIVPLALALIWKFVKKERFTSTLIGAAMFAAFAIVLESFPKLLFFQANNPVGKFVLSNPAAFVIVGALLAGIFEETGRFVAFKVFLKKRRNKETAISYGIGHGGIEVMYLLVSTGITYLIYALMINAGTFEAMVAQVAAISPEEAKAYDQIAAAITQMTIGGTFISLWERVSAMILHISLSVVVFKAAMVKGKVWMYPVAILTHALFDVPAALYQVGVLKNVIVVECMFTVLSILIAVVAFLIYKGLPTKEQVAAENEAEAAKEAQETAMEKAARELGM